MIRLLLGSLIAAIVLFGFGAAFWTCPIPYAYVEKPSSSNEALGSALREHLPNDGIYLVPGLQTENSAAQDKAHAGPVATIHYRRDGIEPRSMESLGVGFLHGWVTTFLLGVLLQVARPPRFGQRVTLVTIAGLALTNYIIIGNGLYWFQPWPWLVLNAAYTASAMLVTGLILGAVIVPAVEEPKEPGQG